MNIKPLGDRVLIKLIESEEITKGGIYIPDTAKEKPQEGEIVAVGPGKILDDGKRAPMEVKVGDIVLFAKYSGTELKRDGVDYMLLNVENGILAVVE